MERLNYVALANECDLLRQALEFMTSVYLGEVNPGHDHPDVLEIYLQNISPCITIKKCEELVEWWG